MALCGARPYAAPVLGFGSRSKIDKLGERLAKKAIPDESDLQQLQRLRAAYDSVENQLARAEETENAFEGRPSQDEEYLRLRVMNQMQKDRLEVTRGGLSQLLERLLGVLRDQK